MEKDFPFSAYIMNLGKYNEGELVGKWIHFPTDYENMQEALKCIGIGQKNESGETYEEWLIGDYDCYVNGIENILGEYENFNELNYFASKLCEIEESELELFQAAIVISDYTSSIKDLINLTDNLDKYELMSYIKEYEDLGRNYIENTGIEISKELEGYINYERCGRDLAINQEGLFSDYGYIRCIDESFEEYYDGNYENIPEEYWVTHNRFKTGYDKLVAYFDELEKFKPECENIENDYEDEQDR